MRDRQQRHRHRQMQGGRQGPHEKRIRFQAQDFCFVFGIRFVSFLHFYFLFFLFACSLYCVLEWAQHFYLIYVDISLGCAFCFMLHALLPILLLLLFLPSCTAAGNLFDCWSACISLYFFGYVCRSRRYVKKERAVGVGIGGSRACNAYILLVLVVDIYFMSQITFIGTWHTLEIRM